MNGELDLDEYVAGKLRSVREVSMGMLLRDSLAIEWPLLKWRSPSESVRRWTDMNLTVRDGSELHQLFARSWRQGVWVQVPIRPDQFVNCLVMSVGRTDSPGYHVQLRPSGHSNANAVTDL